MTNYILFIYIYSIIFILSCQEELEEMWWGGESANPFKAEYIPGYLERESENIL